MTTIHFHRAEDWATCHGIVARGSDPYFDLCRMLADRGWTGPATFVDERGMACMTTRSIPACAYRYRPNEVERARKEAKRKERKAT